MAKSKEQKREEAQERQAARDSRTPEEQLSLVMKRTGGNANGTEVDKLFRAVEERRTN